MKVVSSLVSYTQPALLVKPTDGAFDYPAKNSQPAAMFGTTLGQKRFDAQPVQQSACGLGIVGAVAVKFIRPRSRWTWLAADRGNVNDQRHELHHVVFVGAGELNDQRHTLSVNDQV